jgi:PST family polysaccharide transporter
MLATVCLLTAPIAAYTIACSDWVIEILLGKEWSGAAEIFAWLGILAFSQPVASTTGWVFVTQGRAGEQFRAGLMISSISVVSFAAGLPWGGVGVAIAYSLSGVLIRTPLLFWLAGRSGAVLTSDFYRVPAPFAAASLASLGVVAAMRQSIALDPLTGAAAGLLLIVLVNIAVMAILPAGRQTMMLCITTARDAMGTKAND